MRFNSRFDVCVCVYLSTVDFFLSTGVSSIFTACIKYMASEKLNRTTAFGYLHGRHQKPVMVNINMFEMEWNQKERHRKNTRTHTHTG